MVIQGNIQQFSDTTSEPDGRSVGSARVGPAPSPRLGGSVGRNGPTLKFPSPRCARRVGRSERPESETQKNLQVGRSVGDA